MFGNDTWQSLGAMIVLVYVTIMQYTIEFKTLLALLKVVFITCNDYVGGFFESR